MTVFDTHKAFVTFTGAGFSAEQAQALLDAGQEGSEALATKADLKAQETALRSEMQAMERALRNDLQAVETSLNSEIQTLRAESKTDLRDLEQRMTIRLGAMLFTAIGLQVAVLGLLLVLIAR